MAGDTTICGALVGLVCVIGCGPGLDSSTGGDGDGQGSTGSESTSTSDASTEGGGTSEGSRVGEASTGDACPSVCIADFPCVQSAFGCVDSFTIEQWESREVSDCAVAQEHWVCVDACSCWGTVCVQGEPRPCGPGQFCVERGIADYPDASCLPLAEACGGSGALSCAKEEFCDYQEGSCPPCAADPGQCNEQSPLGWCRPVPISEDCGQAFPGQEVCGCDAVEYANDCLRMVAGVAVAHVGPCS